MHKPGTPTLASVMIQVLLTSAGNTGFYLEGLVGAGKGHRERMSCLGEEEFQVLGVLPTAFLTAPKTRSLSILCSVPMF